MTKVELTPNERAVLEALYHAEQRGETILNDAEISIITKIPLETVMLTTANLKENGYIEWNQRAVH